MPGDRVFEGMYTLDYEQVARGVQEPALPAELAAKLSGKFVYLFVGHFTPERRVPALVRAFLETARADSALLLIGQGPDLEEVTALARRPGGQVRVVPGVPFDHLHAYYGRADAYVHPGGEPYSLAMQEAALLGIPLRELPVRSGPPTTTWCRASTGSGSTPGISAGSSRPCPPYAGSTCRPGSPSGPGIAGWTSPSRSSRRCSSG